MQGSKLYVGNLSYSVIQSLISQENRGRVPDLTLIHLYSTKNY